MCRRSGLLFYQFTKSTQRIKGSQESGQAQSGIERKLYILTYSNTKDKKVLDLINTVLHLGWMMEFIGR